MAEHKLKLLVKQGEEISRTFTIKSGDSPLDLSDYTIKFQVKNDPYVEVEPLIDKEITTTSDINTVGQITSPSLGEWQVRLTEADTCIPTGEYYLIIFLNQGTTKDIISSNNCCNAKYIVCSQ